MPIPHVEKKKTTPTTSGKKTTAAASDTKKSETANAAIQAEKPAPEKEVKKDLAITTENPSVGKKKKKKKKDVGSHVATPASWKGLNRKDRKKKLKKELANASSRKEKRKIKKAAHKSKPWYKRLVSWRFLWRFGLVMGVFGIIAGSAAAVGLYMWVAKDLASVDDIENRKVDKTTKIYASDGKTLLYEVGDNKRIDTTLDKIDDDIEHALISIEDKRFYEHGAVDLRGISRAAWANFRNKEIEQGASTLTQQFVSNTVLTRERTYERKLKEMVLSVRLEQKYGKEKVLEMYLNNIYFGANIQGIEAAAQEYFDTSAEKVSLAEAATLASLPQNPVVLTNDPDALEYRKNTTLDIMVEEGYITQEEADSAKAEKVEVVEDLEDTLSMKAPHFANYVNGILEEQFGQNTVRRGGLEVITTIDLDQQKIAKKVISEHIADVESYGGSNAALVHIDPKTGFIKAMVGSRDFSDKEREGQVNVATSLRQPGSSLKPFAYLLAFSKGYTPETKEWDVETDFLPVAADGSVTGGEPYRPRNYSLTQSGPITFRQALATSLNIPAVKVLYLAGLPDFFDMLERFGYTSFQDRERFGLSIVLGGGEVSLLEHTNGYAILAAEGQHREAVSIQMIKDADGNVIYEWKDEPKEAMEAQYVHMITNVLSDTNARGSIFYALNLADRPFAAKTGTTDDHRDAWAMGYTPSHAVGIWTGNNDNSPMGSNADGVYVAAPILTDYVTRITEGTPAEEFPAAEYSAANDILAGNLYAGEKDVTVDKITGKRIPDDCTTYPAEYIEVRSERVGHTLLYYLDKNNPTVLSNTPNPGNDPMFENWEKAIGNYGGSSEEGEEEESEEQGTISDDYMPCDARDEESEPGASLNLSSSEEYTPKTLRFFGNVTGIGETTVQFFIDGNLIDTQVVNLGDEQSSAPVEASYSASNLTSGSHTMSLVVTDAVGRTAESSASIYFTNGNEDEEEEEPAEVDEEIDEEEVLEEIESEEQGKEEEEVEIDDEEILDEIEE